MIKWMKAVPVALRQKLTQTPECPATKACSTYPLKLSISIHLLIALQIISGLRNGELMKMLQSGN